MKKLLVCLNLFALLSPAVFAFPGQPSAPSGIKIKSEFARQNLIGEVTAIDQAGGKIVIQTDAKTSVTVIFNDQTIFRRVMPGETSLAAAETIKITDIKIGDRLLIPGLSAAGEPTPVKQIVVMARSAIEKSRDDELEKRRARTLVGRITAVNAEKREITVQSRGRGNAEAIIVAAPGNVRLMRYAPDSLKLSDAVAGSFADLKVGDQIRVVGDRSCDGARVAAEEIIFGSVSRTVGTVSEVNPTRGEVVVKNNQTGQSMTVAIGKNTTLRRITPEAAAILKQRFERRARRSERSSNETDQQTATQTDRRQNRDRRRNQSNSERSDNPNRRQLFENLPVITIAEIKKGDAVLITGTSASGGAASQMMAVSIIAGDGELQQILLRTQGGRNGNANMSPGLPGNVSGGNAGSDDDEPER